MILSILLVLFSISTNAQEAFKQNIRGTVVDAITGYALIGANIIIIDSEPIIGTSTDLNGDFVLEGILVGRQSIEVRYVGYANKIIPNLFLSSGKETQVVISLEENAMDMEEVVVRYQKRKDKAQNEMAMISSRTFSVEETERFAGSLGDPARMVANYAGVMTHNDSRNDIIIRGNSPIGVLWRLEGVEIPNPNHFGAMGTTGGPVSMVNNNLLRDSDFLTGAFPAEFGNATAGVFDLKMRSGNSGKHEFTGQVGFNGFEAGIEGPFATIGETQKATYLANYRYSTLGLLNNIGFNFGTGDAIPQYQDLTFLIDLPGTKIGRWKVFGLWGKSFIQLGREPADTTGNSYNPRGTATDFGSSLGVIGLSNTCFFTPKLRLTTTLSYQQTAVTTVLDSTKNNMEVVEPYVRQNQAENKFSVTTQLRHKVNAKNNYSLGIVLDHYYINYVDSINHADYNKFITSSDVSGTLGLARAYAQWQHSFNNQLTGYAGIHAQYFNLNQELSYEPRIALNWQPRGNNTFSLGYGLHSQIQPKSVYFFQTYDEFNDTYYKTNENLGYTKSHHIVLGYDHLFSNNFRIKSETYYQYLFNIPVSNSFGEFSLVNAGDFFNIGTVDSLENRGTGYNYGIELTVEKFLNKGYYFLFTTSLFDSKYNGGDGITRNTAFNGNYVFNLLAGYEKKIGKKTYLTVDIKGVLAGGRRYVPIDVEASLEQGLEVRDWSRAYLDRYDDYFRTDL
ncbi:MAG: TonB-dependent receptor, partial [Bacteroidales bacterium]|nr:TonB-dependent receptor [Bacteroidales bacterium]